MQVSKREDILRKAMEPRDPKGVRKSESVLPTLTHDGLCLCPKCEKTSVTPERWNPYNGEEERLTMLGNHHLSCPNCGCVHWITPDFARAYNHYWFPEDSQFFPEDDS